MADSDFSVYARIQADTSNFEKGMKKAQASATNLSNTFGNLSKVIKTALSFTGIAVGTKALVDFGKASVTAANQANKQFRVLDNTIKATGADAWTSSKEMETLSKSLSNSTNYSVTEIQKMQSVLLGFRDITGETFTEASNAILDMSTVMGMDLTSAVQTVGKALDDPVKGLDSLRRQGFAFTDEQKAELAQLVKTGNKMKAQKIILDELSKTYGGAAKAGQDSFAKQRHAAESLSETLGNKLMPTVKYFAEENSKMFGSMQNLIENIDFNQISATVIAAFSTMKDEIKTLSAPFKSVGEDLKGFVSNINLKPFISVLETLIGAFKRINEININSGIKNIKSLKDVMSGIGENIDLNKVADVINEIINGFVFLYEQVSKVFDTLRDNVKTLVSNIWNSIKSIFEASNKSLADSERDIKSWSDYFYSIFNSLYKNVQNLINLIDALLKGDWKVAWSYAKLVVLEIINSIMTSLDTLVRGFADKIEKIVNTVNVVSTFLPGVLKIGAKEIAAALTGIKKLTEGSGKAQEEIKNLISETEKEITDATGKPANQSLEDLKNYVTSSEGVLGQFVDNFKEATEEAKKELDDIGQYIPSALGTPADAEENGGEVYSIYSEWDSKLLQQRQENLKEWEDEYHKINLLLIEEERKKALEADTTGKDRLKIEEYYNKEIEKENERAEEAKREHVKETISKITGYMKNLASNTVAIFKKVVSTIKNVFSTIGNFIKNAFSGIKDIFSNLFKFNIDDALNSLLEIEDAILTFFTETLPNLPSFFDSAFSSVMHLVQTLMNSINWDQVSNFLNSIVDTFVKYSPEIISGIINIFSNIVDSVTKTFSEKSPEMVNAFGSMFLSIIEALPGILTNIISAVGSFISDIGKYLSENFNELSDDLTNVVKSLIDGISNFITNGGWKNLLNGLLSIQKAIENAIADNMDEIVDTIVKMLPDLVNTLINSIVSASKTLAKVIKPILKLVISIIEAVVDIMFSDEVLDASMEVLEAFFEALTEVAMEVLPKILPKIIAKLIKVIIRTLASFPIEIAKAFLTGIAKAFSNTNWGQFVKDIFRGFIDGIKELFGIHSPSTLFEEFGNFMVEGLINGLKGISESAMIILQPLFETIVTLFNGLNQTIFSIVNTLSETTSSIVSGLFDTISSLTGQLNDTVSSITNVSLQTLNEVLRNTNETFSDLTNITLSSFNSMLSDTMSGVNTLANTSLDGLNNTLKTMTDGLNTITNSSLKGMTDMITGIASKLNDLTNISFKGLKAIVDSSSNSIVNITDSVSRLVSSLTSLITEINRATEVLLAGVPGVGGGSGDRETWKKIFDPLGIILHANGTNNAQKGLSIVGEAGPELVNFRGGEQVLNAHNTQKALEGMNKGNSVFNVTFNNTKDTTAYAMMSQLKQYNRQLAINGIL